LSSDDAALRERTLTLYTAVGVLMVLGIAVLAAYSVTLAPLSSPPLTSPGSERSFGYAVALMSLMAAALFHLVDRTYRVWPLGRRIAPTPPGPVTTAAQVRFLKVLIVVIAAAAIAYLIGGLLA
jgi:hypothetical protein